MAFLEIRRGGRRRVFQILDREFTVGSGATDSLRLESEEIAQHQLRIVQAGAGHRVEAGPGGAAPVVNGRESGARNLLHGDRIRVGPVELIYCEEGRPRPPVELPDPDDAAAAGALELQIDAIPTGRPVARRVARRAPSRSGGAPTAAARRPSARPEANAARPRRTPRRRGMPTGWLIANVVVVTLVVGYLVFRQLGAGSHQKGASDLVTLAEAQRAEGNDERALATLALALERATEPTLRQRIQGLQRFLRDRIAAKADAPLLARARVDADAIRRFVARYLAEEPNPRPAARELVELARAWLDDFRETCARHDESRPMVDEIEDYLRRYRAAAAVGEPASADDVLFAAGRRTRFVPRRYLEAIAILEGWLELASVDASGRERVEQQIVAWRAGGEQWARAQRAKAERAVERGQLDFAIEVLGELIEHGAVPEWLGDAPERLRQLEARRRD